MLSIEELKQYYPSAINKEKEFYSHIYKEYLHGVMLDALSKCEHRDKLVFIGGTAARFFEELQRFSEDLDFDNKGLNKEQFYSVSKEIELALKSEGFKVEARPDEKETLNCLRVKFYFPELLYDLGISPYREQKLLIKFEAEPQNFDYVPVSRELNIHDRKTNVIIAPTEILFSTKISAAINRGKHRDFFDVLHYLERATPNYEFLSKRMGIANWEELKIKLIEAAKEKKLLQTTSFDCYKMLYDIKDLEKIKNFESLIEKFDTKSKKKR
jgi:predicted nucleotidyltransferase component of viral defense system